MPSYSDIKSFVKYVLDKGARVFTNTLYLLPAASPIGVIYSEIKNDDFFNVIGVFFFWLLNYGVYNELFFYIKSVGGT